MKCMIIAPAHPDLVPTSASLSAYTLFTHLEQREQWDTVFVAAGEGASGDPDPRPIRRHRGRDREYVLTLPPVDAVTQTSTQPGRAYELLDQLIDMLRPDLVHLHQAGGLGLGAIVHLKARGLRVVLTLHDSLVHEDETGPVDSGSRPPLRPSERFIRDKLVGEYLRAADMIIAPGSDFARAHIEAALIPPGLITILRSPLDLLSVERKRWQGESSDRSRFMAVIEPGAHDARRNLAKALQELEQVMREPIRLDVFGLLGEGEAAPSMPIPGEPTDPFWQGSLTMDALARRMAAYGSLILPACGSEALCLAQIALSQGVPVIAEDARGLAEVLKPPARGFVFAAGSGLQLGRLMADVMEGRRALPQIDQALLADENALAKASHVSFYRALKAIRRGS